MADGPALVYRASKFSRAAAWLVLACAAGVSVGAIANVGGTPTSAILLSGVFRFQAGANYARTLSVSAPASCACTFSAARGGSLSNTTVYATLYNAYAQDNISSIDVRVEKTVPLGNVAKLRLFLDGFNLANKYAGETITVSTGAAFQQPTAILAPRTMRVGFRFVW